MQKSNARKNISGLVVLFCTIVILSAVGNTFAEEQQVQTQEPSTIIPQPLCQGGICDNSTGQHTNTDLQHTVITLSQRFANSKNLNLNHFFVSNKVIGPDRFRFVTSYWTTSTTTQAIDAGTSANESRFLGGAILRMTQT